MSGAAQVRVRPGLKPPAAELIVSRFGWKLTLAVAEPMAGLIRNGRPVPTMAGGVLGAGFGATAGFAMVPLAAPGALLGAILGAAAGAGLFARPPRPLGVRRTDQRPVSMGGIRRCWTYEEDDFKSLTVLLDRAIYVVRDDKAPWEEVCETLARGIDPNRPLGDLVRLDEIDRLELRGPDATELQVVYHLGSRFKRRGIDFASAADREDFLAALEDQLGGPFVRAEQPMDTRRAVRAPVLVLIALSVLTVGGMLLSSHWTAHPPPPLRTGKQDNLVGVLTWAGPGGVLLAGTPPLLAAVTWFLLRVVRPPRIGVLRHADAGAGTPLTPAPGARTQGRSTPARADPGKGEGTSGLL
jgi:hypothetical protein